MAVKAGFGVTECWVSGAVGAEAAELVALEHPVDPRSATMQTVSSKFSPVRRSLIRLILSGLPRQRAICSSPRW